MPPFDPIPPDRRAAAAAALAAVGADRVTGLAPLSGGVSGAGIYRVEHPRGRLLLRLEPPRVALEHRTRHLACMAAAAQAGVAPQVLASDPATGVTVMAFVEARPLAQHPGGALGLAEALGHLIGRTQAAAPFPRLADGDPLVAVLDGLAASCVVPDADLDPHRDALARVRAVHPWNPAALVPAHNDPNPRNLLFDGARLWLIDWELAFQHDPLFDLAIASLDLAETPALETALLAAAFGRTPSPADRARLHLVRQLARLFYGCIALEAFAGRPPPALAPGLGELTPAGFRAATRDGRLGAGKPEETGYAFGAMSLRAFLDGVAAPSFTKAAAAVT
jgi:hypothetical protein